MDALATSVAVIRTCAELRGEPVPAFVARLKRANGSALLPGLLAPNGSSAPGPYVDYRHFGPRLLHVLVVPTLVAGAAPVLAEIAGVWIEVPPVGRRLLPVLNPTTDLLDEGTNLLPQPTPLFPSAT